MESKVLAGLLHAVAREKAGQILRPAGRAEERAVDRHTVYSRFERINSWGIEGERRYPPSSSRQCGVWGEGKTLEQICRIRRRSNRGRRHRGAGPQELRVWSRPCRLGILSATWLVGENSRAVLEEALSGDAMIQQARLQAKAYRESAQVRLDEVVVLLLDHLRGDTRRKPTPSS